jgi:hypothetical protein
MRSGLLSDFRLLRCTMAKRLIKPKTMQRRTAVQKRKSKLSKKALSLRAKKGWETRRRQALELEETKPVKKALAKKLTKKVVEKKPFKKPTKKPAKKPVKKAAKKAVKKVAKTRAAAAQKGWETRRAAQAVKDAAAQKRSETAKKAAKKRKLNKLYDERAKLNVRENLTEVLPAYFQQMEVEEQKKRVTEYRRRIAERTFFLKNFRRDALIEYITDPELKALVDNTKSDETVLKIAIKQLHKIMTGQFEKVDHIKNRAIDTTISHFKKVKYGTILEAIHMVDSTADILAGIHGFVETEESKLSAKLNAAYGTPQFEAIMENEANERGMPLHALYSFFKGSPSADFVL